MARWTSRQEVKFSRFQAKMLPDLSNRNFGDVLFPNKYTLVIPPISLNGERINFNCSDHLKSGLCEA